MNIKGYHNKYVNLNENNQIDRIYLPEIPIGITKASEMTGDFWDRDLDMMDKNLNTRGSISAKDFFMQIRLTYDTGNEVYYHDLYDDSSSQSIYSRATYKIIDSKLTLIDIYNVDVYQLSPFVEYILPNPENPEQDMKRYLEVIGNSSEPTIHQTRIPIIPRTVTSIVNSFNSSSGTWDFGIMDFSYAPCTLDADSFSSSTTSGIIEVSSYTFRQMREVGLVGSDSQRYLSSNNQITIRIKN